MSVGLMPPAFNSRIREASVEGGWGFGISVVDCNDADDE
jgi:hypothetical protein